MGVVADHSGFVIRGFQLEDDVAASGKSGQEMPAGFHSRPRRGEALRRARGSYAPFYAPQQLFHVKGVALDKRHLCEGFQQGFSGLSILYMSRQFTR